jgi:uncharacterized protein YndB with AHSA1/START domain
VAAVVDEFKISRVFDAPRERVFEAWTDPKHFAQWWGPVGFTNPVCRIDLRSGGAYYASMRSPEAVDHPCHGTYLEIVPPERLVMTMGTEGHPPVFLELLNKHRRELGAPARRHGLQIHMTVLFEEAGAGRTKLTIVQRFDPVTDAEVVPRLGATEGWSGSLDRLAALVSHVR